MPSIEEYRDEVLAHLDEVLSSFPLIDTSFLNSLEEGTYRLAASPTSTFLQSLPEFSGEIGLYHIQDHWVMVVSHQEIVPLSQELHVISQSNFFRLDLHSHPGEDELSTCPSWPDLAATRATIDGYAYIAMYQGLIEYHSPPLLPGGYQDQAWMDRRAWQYWITVDLALTEETYNERGAWNLYREFFETFYGMRVIPWSEQEEIEHILTK